MESDLGVNPSNDGPIIRLPIPTLTEDRRRELVKLVHRLAEDGRVAVRNIRRDAMKDLKELKTEGLVGEDAERRAEEQLQKLTDEHVHADRRAAQAQGGRDPRGLSGALLQRRSRRLTGYDARPTQARKSLAVVAAQGRHGQAPAARRRSRAAAGAAECRYVAIIMDGNGRWAKRRHLPGGRRPSRRRQGAARASSSMPSTAASPKSPSSRSRPRTGGARRTRSRRSWTSSSSRSRPRCRRCSARGARALPGAPRQASSGAAARASTHAEAANPADRRMTIYIAFNYGGRDEIVDAARGAAAEAAARSAAGAGAAGLASETRRRDRRGDAFALISTRPTCTIPSC